MVIINQDFTDNQIAVMVPNREAYLSLSPVVNALHESGYECIQVSPQKVLTAELSDWSTDGKWRLCQQLESARAEEYRGLITAGDWSDMKQLAHNVKACNFFRDFFMLAKPVAVFEGGVELLIQTKVIERREVSAPEKEIDRIEDHKGFVLDKSVVEEKGLISVRQTNKVGSELKRIGNLFENKVCFGQTA